MSVPAERVWAVNTHRIDPQTNQVVADPDALGAAFLEAVGIMMRIGGVLQVATRRAELGDNHTETLAVVFRWRSFVPVDKSQAAPPAERDGTAEQAEAPPAPPVEGLPAEDEHVEAPPAPAPATPPQSDPDPIAA